MGLPQPAASRAWTAGAAGTRMHTVRAGPVLQVTLAHPPVNALDLAAYDELADCLTAADRDPSLHVVLLAGTGRHFCAGQDRGDAGLLAADPDSYLRRAAAAVAAVLRCRHPVIAAVTGAAVGAGLILACSADVLVVAQDALLSLPEARLGIVAGHAHLRYLAGGGLARMAALTGRPLPPRLLAGAGVKVVARPRVAPAATEIAAGLAELDPDVARAVRAGWQPDRNRLLVEYRKELEHTARIWAAGTEPQPLPLACAVSKRAHRCRPGMSRTLGRSAVFADQAAEDLPALDPGGDIHGVAGFPHRRFLPQGLMRTMAVAVPGVPGQDAA